MSSLDEHGQPFYPFGSSVVRNHEKTVDQLLGLCRGILCDGEVNLKEAEAFAQWVKHQPHEAAVFPFNQLIPRINRIYGDGEIDEEERLELGEIMRQLGGFSKREIEPETLSTALPLCNPAPDIHFAGAKFVITGRCAFGSRARVAAEIEKRGGFTADQPCRSTKYLLVGHFASHNWLHACYGRKIEHAVQLRADGAGIAIISESHWLAALNKIGA